MTYFRFPTSYDNQEKANRIFQTVGRSPFTGNIVGEILGIHPQKTGSFFGALKNAKVIEISHYSKRIPHGQPVRWYRFTNEWLAYQEENAAKGIEVL